MKIKLIIILAFINNAISCQNNDSITPKIKSEKIIDFALIDNELIHKSYNPDKLNEYLLNGKLFKVTTLPYWPEHKKEIILDVVNYDYNKDNSISKKITTYDLKNKDKNITSYIYKDGRLVEESTKTYKDGKENLTFGCFKTEYNYKNDIEESKTYAYDENKKELIFSFSIQKTYNESKNILTEKHFNSENNLSETINYTYKNNRKIGVIKETGNNITEVKLEYNKIGDIEKRQTDYRASYMPFSQVDIYNYKYDDYGNWIEREYKSMTNKDSEFTIMTITKRLIEYY